MSTELRKAPHDDTVYSMMDKFLGLRMRHLLIEKDGAVIGMLSAGDVSRASLALKNEELKELNAYVSWEYYDNWRWPRR